MFGLFDIIYIPPPHSTLISLNSLHYHYEHMPQAVCATLLETFRNDAITYLAPCDEIFHHFPLFDET